MRQMRRVLLSLVCSPLASALWPIPAHYTHGETELWIDPNVQVQYDLARAEADGMAYQNDELAAQLYVNNAPSDPPNSNDQSNSLTPQTVLNAAVNRTLSTIFKTSPFAWKFHPRGWSPPWPNEASTYVSRLNLIQLQPNPSPDNFLKPLDGEIDESYKLVLPGNGLAEISANSTIGLLRGLTTFSQLFFSNPKVPDSAYTPLAPIDIFDTPKFVHRGVNLDVARAWIPVSRIKRTIDAVAFSKMNVLHLHATDSQSWPLDIPTIPELARQGAYRPEFIYSAEDFDDIQRYAALRGVQLITEIDMPGHTSSIWYSFPELIAAFNKQPWDTWAAEPPSGTLKLNSDQVTAFLNALFNDLLPRVAPWSRYFHTGGDEVNKKAYTLDDTVNSDQFDVLQPLMQKFVSRNHDHVRNAGLTPIVWEEMVLDWDLKLGTDVVVQTWQSDEAVAKVVEKGYKVLVGNYKYWYLDCGKGQWLDFPPSSAGNYYPFNDYCAPFHNWRLIYSYDPLSGVSTDKQHLVLGGETHIWGEQTDPVNLDRMLWPRAAAAAEVLWSGAKDVNGRNRSQVDASPRLSEFRERLVAMGIGAEPIQMPYCTMDKEQCILG